MQKPVHVVAPSGGRKRFPFTVRRRLFTKRNAQKAVKIALKVFWGAAKDCIHSKPSLKGRAKINHLRGERFGDKVF